MNQNLPTTQTTRFDQLRQRAEMQKAGEIWKPNDGDTLIGEIVGSDTVTHPQYGAQHQAIVASESGALVRVWLSEYLKKCFKSQNAERGDLVALTYLGKGQGANGKQYNRYSVVVEKMPKQAVF